MAVIGVIVFFAIFTQTLTGFGLALVSMPLLVLVMDIQVASPLVALIGIVAEVILLARYREHLQVRTIWRLAIASIIGVPIGVMLLRHVDSDLILTILGVVIAGYAGYGLLNFRLPAVEHQNWAYGFGFVAGVLSGAYNTAGPPVVIYGNCRQWEPRMFKGNLQGFFILNSLMLVGTHGVNGNYTGEVWTDFLIALPAIGLGIVAGSFMDQFLNPVWFRKGVLVLLVVLGGRLIVG
jgi:hypothetical protein